MKNLPKLHELSFEDYKKAKASGMFWVYYPEATGDYDQDVLDRNDPDAIFYMSSKTASSKGKNTQESSVEPYEYCEAHGSISSNEVENTKEDLVKMPSHYQLLPEYEVKHVIKALLDKIDASDFEMSSFQAGWLQQSLQYQLRFYAKNGLEDLEKAYETLGFVIEDMRKKD